MNPSTSFTRADKLRWGVLSTASIGRRSVNPAIRQSKNGDLLAVASRDAERARAFATETGIERHYGSYEALLRDSEIDAIYIPLPNALHREWSMKAAEHGKHVLCEKPLALNAAECREMEAAAQANDTLLMEAFMYRFHPRIQHVARQAQSGALGAVRSIRSTFTFRLTRPHDVRFVQELGGGALYDVGCYCVNVSRTLAGVEPEEVQALANWGLSGVDHELAGVMRFPGGLLAHFDCALSMDRRETVEVAGVEASLAMDAVFVPGVAASTVTERRGGAVTTHEVAGANQYVLMVEHFADCVMGRETLRYPASEAAANMAVIDALYRSARAGGAPTPVTPHLSSSVTSFR